jgi:hypothetical protein
MGGDTVPGDSRRSDQMSRYFLAALLAAWGLAMLPACSQADVTDSNPAAGPVQPSRWPMHVTSAEGADVTIFQPQLEDFQGNTLTGRAAVAVIPSGQQTPVFGAIWLQSRVETDRSARTVQVLDVQVTKVLFPSTAPITAGSLSDAARQAILAQPITLSLDHLLASLETIKQTQEAAADLQTTPPTIVFKDHPAVKVQYDGDPRLVQAGDGGLMRVVNTPFFVALDPSSKTYFLKGAGHWFSAPDPMGPFSYSTQIPPAISQLAGSSGYSDPQQAIPDDEVSRLEIVTANTPTELIWSDGQPQMSTIPGTGLLYWANTDSDVFLDISNQLTYVLLSGRWYSAANMNGPWTYVSPDQLPGDFAKIPADSPKAGVLAQVPGTQAAQDAVADTVIPQTAAVDCNNYEQPPVTYDGDPDFEPIQGAQCSYAVNTDCAVLNADGFYYCCYNAVWYQCPTPRGPWVISYRVPREIYRIPPSCPIYPVCFVRIYGYTGQMVYVGYTPGYVGCYAFNGVVVYGTGYRYQPWYRQQYVPRPSTFGFAAQYHPYSGRWGFSFGLASGGGQTWIAAPEKARADGGWFGYGGYRPSQAATTLKINRTIIETNNVQRTTYDVNVYQRRTDVHPEAPGVSPTGPGRGNPVATPPIEHQQPPTQQRETPAEQKSELNSNNVYVNDQGDVYRRTDSGWEKREGNDWKQQPPERNNQPKEREQPPEQTNQPSRNEPQQSEQPAQPQPAPPAQNRNEQQNQPAERQQPQQPQQPQGGGAPDQDYQARQRGEERERQSSPPPPPPAPAPRESSGGQRR